MHESDEESASKSAGMERLLGIARRRKWVGLLTFAAAATAVISTVIILPDVYRSAATVLVERQQIPDDLIRSTVTSVLEVRLQTISQEILSRSRLEALIDRFGLYTELRKRAPMENVIERMRDDIRLELKGGERKGPDRATIAFTISYSGPDPKLVAAVTNTLVSSYIEENLKVRERQAAGTSDFLRIQLDETKARLAKQEEEVSAFKGKHMGALPQQMQANLTTLDQLTVQLRGNSDKQIRNSERRSALEKQIAEQQQAGAPEEPMSPGQRLASLKKALIALQSTYSDKYPDIIRTKREIAALEEQLKSQNAETAADAQGLAASGPQATQLRRALAEVDAEDRALKAEAENLGRVVATYRTRVEATPQREQEFQALSRDYETSKDMYRSLMVKQREAELAENMEQRQKGELFRVIDPALPSEEPASPKRPQLLGVGLVLALALGAAAMFLIESLDPALHSIDDLRALTSLPVLASIPAILTRHDLKRRHKMFGVGVAATCVALVAIVAASYLLARPDGPLAAALK